MLSQRQVSSMGNFSDLDIPDSLLSGIYLHRDAHDDALFNLPVNNTYCGRVRDQETV